MSLLQNSNAIPQIGGYNLTDSLRFRSSASASLERTPTTTGNQKTFTASFWIKRGLIVDNVIMSSGETGDGDADLLQFHLTNASLRLATATTQLCLTNAVLRDPSSWYHVVLAVDTTQATASDRIKIYLNNLLLSFSASSMPAQNTDFGWNKATNRMKIARAYNDTGHFDGYMTEIHSVDGQALTPSDFGETDTITGVWQPKKYTGTYGTNGFYLPMNQTVETYDSSYLVVAGGAGGGGTIGGGGGAGGYRSSWNNETSGGGASAESAITLFPGNTYTITVGAGGSGGPGGDGGSVASHRGSNGGVSSISGTGISITTTGGGGGTGYTFGASENGIAGGSGGGPGGSDSTTYTPGSGTASQGYAGGANRGGGSPWCAGAGGGAASVGGAGTVSNGGNGGSGRASTITGSSITRAGGGGGATLGAGAGSGGSGGGGAGSSSGNGTAGTVNTGGGGGGGSYSAGVGGNGGSGVVILRVPTSRYSGIKTGGTTTTSGSDTIITWTSSGSYTA